VDSELWSNSKVYENAYAAKLMNRIHYKITDSLYTQGQINKCWALFGKKLMFMFAYEKLVLTIVRTFD